MKRKSLLLTGFAICLCTLVFGQAKLVEKITRKGNEIVIPYEKYVLPNGLTLVIHEDHSDPIAHIDVTYHVGSAREQIGKSGFAHFFEHMMFEGSDHALKGQHDKIISGNGGSLNGSTNRDRTNYYETVPINLLEKTLWLESDRMGFLLGQVTQPRFEVQRATVKNERGQRVDNVSYGLVTETFGKNLYPYGHPYSWEVIGYIEDLNRSNVEDLKNFFLRWYGPNNATLTIGGDVKPAEVVKMVEKYFGSLPRCPEVKPAMYPAVKLDNDRYVSYTDNYAKLPMLAVVFPTVPNYDKDMAALQCLSQVIGQGRTSVLYQQLVKKQIALQSSSFSRLSELSGEFIFQLIPLPGKTLGQMDTLLRACLDSFEKRGVTDDDITKFKGQTESQQINGLQSVNGKVNQLANFQTFTGNPNKIADLLKMYTSLTKEDVMAAYYKYIKGKHAVYLSVLTKNMDASLTAAPNNYSIDESKYVAPEYGYAGLAYVKAKDNFDRAKIPASGPNPVVKVPKIWRKDMTNGIRVIGTENTEIPTVTVSITIPGGHLLQAKDTSKIGLASFFASMMNEDTKNYTAEQLSLALQKLGSNVNIGSNTDEITFNVQSLTKNIVPTLALLEERMFNPRFTEEAFKRTQRQTMEGLKQAKGQPNSVASDISNKLNYGPNNILGMNENGTEYTVKNMTLKDIQNYYDNYMTSNGMKVVIVGDVKEEDILPKLSFLTKLPNKKIEMPVVAATPVPLDQSKIYLVDIPKAAQTEFRVGYNTGLKYDATGEYYRAGLMNYTLGGAFTSRLNMDLREDKGWTYGASSGFSGDEYGGDWNFSSGIKAEATDSALAEAMKDIRDYVENGLSDNEFAMMKSAIGQRDALRYETGAQKANFIRNILNYNLPENYTTLQQGIVKNMTKKQIETLAKKWVNPAKLNMLLVGDKAKILPGLQKLGYPIVELDAEGKLIEKKAF
ncbi:MAG TPA: pitrilysin family protein [Chitinophagaceae bacterium]|nr:pitrilysin family protein [Chitinophagaceae bacterium]